MCFGHSDSAGESNGMATRGSTNKAELKRGRSPAKAEQAEPQDCRKLSKLDSTASTLANKQQTVPQKPDASLNVKSDTEADKKIRGRTSLSSENTLSALSITENTPLRHRTAFLEAHNAPESLYSYTFQQFVGLSIYSALRFQFKSSVMMSNAELGVCFDLIAKTSQQDYQSSRKGWDPGYKMLEMSDKQMMYLLVRQAEGYVGTNKVSEPASSSPNAGEIIGFLSFRFEPEDEDLNLMRPVQYIYELHLDDRLRGQGLGGHMLRWAEEQARLVKISKTMLTVFTVNEGARRLYAREGYVKDMTSPGDRVTRRRVIKPDYIIMGKEI